MERFHKLIYVVLAAGILSGLFLFALQRFTTFPLIQKAEVYESTHHHSGEAWQPNEGFERTAFTVLTTVLTAIGFSAVLFGTVALVPVSLNWHKGLLWGLAAFACINLAPSLGLPPQPPGTAVADLYARQQWWVLAVVSTAAGLWLLFDSRRSMFVRPIGFLFLILPHIIGAPVAQGESAVPVALIHQFTLLSILTTGLFWMFLGAIGGFFHSRAPSS